MNSSNHDSRVFILTMQGKPLMPCRPSKARKLLNAGKARVVKKTPFTIQLNQPCGECVQDISVGVDIGAKYVGIAVQSSNQVLHATEIRLRQDVSENLMARRILRRSRRNRKCRYRQARFLNRVKSNKAGWLPPSILSRVHNTIRWINTFVAVLPKPKLILEVGKFDMQNLEKPDINGIEYQQGEQLGYENVKAYVLARDNYTCQVCKARNTPLQVHHIIYRSQGGSNKPSNLLTVCTHCHTHDNHAQGGKLHALMVKGKKVTKSYRESAFMNAIRTTLFTAYPDATITYGYITKLARQAMGLAKSHVNDAMSIAGCKLGVKTVTTTLIIQQCRKKKRSLHEAIARKGRKTKNSTQTRNAKNTKAVELYQLHDTVRLHLSATSSKIGFISGFTGKSAYVQDINGNYLYPSKQSYKQVPLSQLTIVQHNNNWKALISPLLNQVDFRAVG